MKVLNIEAMHEAARKDPATPLRAFVAMYQSDMLTAAIVLGGLEGGRLWVRLCEGVSVSRQISPITRRMMYQVLALLTYQNIHDPDRIESALLSSIPIGDPIIDEFDGLAKKLSDAIEHLESGRHTSCCDNPRSNTTA